MKPRSMFYFALAFMLMMLFAPALSYSVDDAVLKQTPTVAPKQAPTTEHSIGVASNTWVNDGTLFMTLHEVAFSDLIRLQVNLHYMKSYDIKNLELRMWNAGGNVFVMFYFFQRMLKSCWSSHKFNC